MPRISWPLLHRRPIVEVVLGLGQMARAQGNSFFEVRPCYSRPKRCQGKAFRPRGLGALRRQVLPWPEPCLVLSPTAGGQPWVRQLIADTGAGTARAGFELLAREND